jgi:hypothetical protein
MKNKTLMITIMILMSLLSGLPYWLDVIYGSETNNFLYNRFYFFLTGIAFLFSFYFLISEVEKINKEFWLMLLIIIPISVIVLTIKFGGAFPETENKLLRILSEPIAWVLIATLIGNLVLFFYKRNKPQMN